jgi:hypothetical protein
MTPCPYCHKDPANFGHSIFLSPVVIDGTLLDEVSCGSCKQFVGRVLAPVGVVGSCSYARQSWERVVGELVSAL